MAHLRFGATRPARHALSTLDEQAEFEAPFRGYLPDVVVELEDGTRHRLSFIDLSRLEQALADNTRAGHSYYAEPGLVVLPEVSTEAIQLAVQELWDEGYFQPRPTG